MDVPKVRAELDSFVSNTTLVTPPPTPGIVFFGDDRHTAASDDVLIPGAQVVEQILAHRGPRR